MLSSLLILSFEWVNIDEQYHDESFIETAVRMEKTPSPQHKVDLQKIIDTEKSMKNEILIIKFLLVIITLFVFYCMYKLNKGPTA